MFMKNFITDTTSNDENVAVRILEVIELRIWTGLVLAHV